MQNYVQSFDIAALVDGLYGIIQENEAVCRVLLFGRRSTELIHRMIVYAHDLSIASWRRTLKKRRMTSWKCSISACRTGF